MVDTARIGIRSKNSVVAESGLGDGVYPIYGLWNFGFKLQCLIVDFELHKPTNWMLEPGQGVDEWGFPEENYDPDEEATAAARLEYDLQRKAELRKALAPGGRFSQGPPCPRCNEPLRTNKAKQCFKCGWQNDRDSESRVFI